MICAFVLSWVSTMVLLVCATLCIASGLFYLAEVVEEYPEPTKKFIGIALITACVLNAAMWLFEGYPLLEVVLPGLVAHGFYSLLLPTFPVCNFASVGFVSSTVMFCVHQYCVFSYFSRHYYVFADVLAYFTVCVWLVPFIFFVSLTSNDGNLPTKSSDGQASATPAARRSSKVGLKSMLNFLSWKSDDLPKIHETLNETHSHSSLGMGGDQYHQNNGNMSGYESAGSFQSRSNSPYDNQPGSNGANIGGTNPYHRQHSNHFEPQNTYGNVGSRSYDYSQKHI